jgi:hypothetical protein
MMGPIGYKPPPPFYDMKASGTWNPTSVYDASSSEERARSGWYLKSLLGLVPPVMPIPDLDTQSFASVSITKEFKQSADHNPATVNMMILPKYRGVGLAFTYNELDAAPGQVSQVVPIDRMTPSREIGEDFAQVRCKSALYKFYSSTTSTTAAALSGTISGMAFENLNAVDDFRTSKFISYAITDRDFVMDQPVQQGLVYTPGPELRGPYETPPGLNEGAQSSAKSLHMRKSSTTFSDITAAAQTIPIADLELIDTEGTFPPRAFNQATKIRGDCQIVYESSTAAADTNFATFQITLRCTLQHGSTKVHKDRIVLRKVPLLRTSATASNIIEHLSIELETEPFELGIDQPFVIRDVSLALRVHSQSSAMTPATMNGQTSKLSIRVELPEYYHVIEQQPGCVVKLRMWPRGSSWLPSAPTPCKVSSDGPSSKM